MTEYTVVGMFADTGERFAGHVEAASANEAEAIVLGRERDFLAVCATFQGYLTAADSETYVRGL